MQKSERLHVLQVALMLGPVEDVEKNIKEVLAMVTNEALWPAEPKPDAKLIPFRI